MTVANQCPQCGADDPASGGGSETYESKDASGITWRNEDIYCRECGAQCGGFSHVINNPAY